MTELGLPEVTLIRQEDDAEQRAVYCHVEAKERMKRCPECGGTDLVQHAKRIRVLLDVKDERGWQIIICLKHHRYKCRDCDHVAFQRFKFFTGQNKVTNRLARELKDLYAEGYTYSDLAYWYGVDIHTIMRYCKGRWGE